MQRKLKRIKDRFREMTQWFEQVMLEDADEDNNDVIPVQDKAPESTQEDQEEEEEVQVEPTDEQVHGLQVTPVTKVTSSF